MKRFLMTAATLVVAATTAMSQGSLPEKFMLMGGGGLSLSEIDRPDMEATESSRLGYTLSGCARFYVSPIVGIGAAYDYMRLGRGLQAHNFGPEAAFTLRGNDNNGAWTMLFGLGCMNYRETVRTKEGMPVRSSGDYFFSLTVGVEYDFHVGGILSGAVYAKMHGSDFFANPNFRIANPYPYIDDGEYHGLFDCRKFFLNIGLAVCLGR